MQADYREIAEEYTHAVKKFFGDRLVSICFFGSVARKEATLESDIDVLVVAQKLPRDFGFRAREALPIHETLRRTYAYQKLRRGGRSAFVSDLLLSPAEVVAHPPILLDLVDDGVIVYDRDSFLEGILEDVRRRLRELGSRKVKAKKGYYWILKADAKPSEVIEI